MDNNTKQIILDDELDNITMVNGTIDPAVNVPAQVVRLRILNASSHRVLQFGFNDNRIFHQITSDDGLLNAPVELTRLRLGSGERAEILVNFSGQSGSTFFIRQYGNELPAGFPGGPSMMGGAIGPLDNKAFNFLQINVVEPSIAPVTAIPSSLTTNVPWSTNGSTSRNFIIQGSPMMSMTNFTINSVQYDEQVNNFTMEEGDVMVWRITNQSMMAHPFHIHGNHFFITSLNGQTPPANMQGRKDVVLVAPMGGTATLITKYEDFCDPEMPYMYHCHILSHEDNGMMGQFIVDCATTANHEIESQTDNLLVYPNPTANLLHIEWRKPAEVFSAKIYNAIGEILLDKISNNDIDISALYPGIYFLQVDQDQEVRTIKFIKQ
jgi:bilirubin oxidase